jgi:uncharacterized membrane protein
MVEQPETNEAATSGAQDAARIALGMMLVFAGTSHLTFARKPFKAQVPRWVPQDPDTVVLESGVVEIALGTALLALPEQKALVGRVAGAFFVAIFPGNLSQWKNRRSLAWTRTGDGLRGFSFSRCWWDGLCGVRGLCGGGVSSSG